jgi:gamma-glutamyltranspeptidase/glutathione hydrolase
MTPTIVFDQKGLPILTTGSPGGSTIITIVLQIILNVLEFDMGIAEASSVPRIHHQWFPDRLYLESGISEDTKSVLKTIGHKISPRTRIMGSTQSIQKGPNNFLFGKSDPRRQGAGEAVQK